MEGGRGRGGEREGYSGFCPSLNEFQNPGLDRVKLHRVCICYVVAMVNKLQ